MKFLCFGSLIAILLTSFSALARPVEFDRIESFEIVSQEPHKIVFDVSYYFNGRERKRPVFIGVEGYENQTACDYLSCQPARVRPGKGVARLTLLLNERERRRRVTNKISFFLYHQGKAAFEKEEAFIETTWSRRRERIPPAVPVDRYTDYAVCFPDVVITAQRNGSGISITSGRTILTNGKEWEYRAVQPGIFSIRRKSWRKRNWTVNTRTGRVVEGKLRLGGLLQRNKSLPFRVTNNRHSCSIHLGAGRLSHQLGPNTYELEAGGYVLSNCAGWNSHCVRPDLYHLQGPSWGRSFWAADLSRKESYLSRRGSRFTKAGNRFQKLPYALEVN